MDHGSPLNGVEGHDSSTLRDTTNGSGLLEGHRRSLSGGLLSKLSFLRASAEDNLMPADGPPSPEYMPGDDQMAPISSSKKPGRAMAVVVQQQKTRRRKGSLRKAALLGRGAQREKNDLETSPLTADTLRRLGSDGGLNSMSHFHTAANSPTLTNMDLYDDSNLVTNGALPRLSTNGSNSKENFNGTQTTSTSPTLTYTSTTDEEDILSIPKHLPPLLRNADSLLSSGSESYFPSPSGSLTRRRSQQKQNPSSPLSNLGGIVSSSTLPAANEDWDYAETEWWGWVILFMTWIVFVIGMGSCFGVWSWAWDVGETPYAPPELEDDPTLPIVGYYPALIILTAVMAWVWVVVAWVGMKYFRHAKISGD